LIQESRTTDSDSCEEMGWEQSGSELEEFINKITNSQAGKIIESREANKLKHQ